MQKRRPRRLNVRGRRSFPNIATDTTAHPGGTHLPIDIHAHYIPPQLIDAVAARGNDLGVRLARSPGDGPPALHFDYGFKVRPFFPRLAEPVGPRLAWLRGQGIHIQNVATWPDNFGYRLPCNG